MKYQLFFPLRHIRKKLGLSERAFAATAKISRRCLRQMEQSNANITINSFCTAAQAAGRNVNVLVAPEQILPEFSTVATAFKVERDGFDSWKIHFMELIDEFRRTMDPRLILLPPPARFDRRLTALLASLVRHLCLEQQMTAPEWSVRRYFLEQPWFVAGVQSLKASAIVESPLAFRNNNIYVHSNFTARV